MCKSVWKLKICFFYYKEVSCRKMRVRTVGTQIGRNLSNCTGSHCASHLHCFSVTANRFRRSRLINLRRFADRLGGCEWKRIAGRQAGGGGGGGGSGMQRAAVGCWLLAHFSLVFFFSSDASLPACLRAGAYRREPVAWLAQPPPAASPGPRPAPTDAQCPRRVRAPAICSFCDLPIRSHVPKNGRTSARIDCIRRAEPRATQLWVNVAFPCSARNFSFQWTVIELFGWFLKRNTKYKK